MMNRHPKRRYLMFAFFAIVFIALGGLAVMLLWNHVLTTVVTVVKPLTYWQAIGILALCKLLFGGFRGKPNRHGRDFKGRMEWREKMMNISEEEREKFRTEWRQRCGRR